MRRISVLFCIAVLAFCSCSKVELAGVIDSVEISVPMDFSSIDIEGCFDVRLNEDCTTATVTSDVNVLPYIEIFETDGTLKVRFSRGFRLKNDGWNTLQVIVDLPYKEGIKAVSLSGASSFSSDQTMTADNISLSVSGASTVTCDVSAAQTVSMNISGASSVGSVLSANDLNLVVSGASRLRTSGKVSRCQMNISGASTVSGISETQKYSLEISDCRGELSGASHMDLHCDGFIKCYLSGASSMSVSGSADFSQSVCDGGSTINRN